MDYLSKVLANTERVLCHNDLHFGNILVEENENVFLIDF